MSVRSTIFRFMPEGVRRIARKVRFALVRGAYGRFVPVLGSGEKFSVSYNTYREFQAARKFRSFEPEFLRAFEEEVTRAKTVYDIGGFMGLYTLTAAVSKQRPQVFIFEPNDANCASIKGNIELNNLTGVRLFQCAVGESEGTVKISDSGGSTTSVTVQADETGTSIPVASIDRMVESGQTPPPDLVKIDVEGYELRVLRGMQMTLRHHRPVVLMEVHPGFLRKFGDSEAALDQLMNGVGYEKCTLREPGHGEKTTHRQKHVIYRPKLEQCELSKDVA